MRLICIALLGVLGCHQSEGKDPNRTISIEGQCRTDIKTESNNQPMWDAEYPSFGLGARTMHGTREMFAPVELPINEAHDEHFSEVKWQWNR